MDECIIEIYLSLSIGTVYASPDPNAGSVILQKSSEAMGLWVFI